MWDTYWHLAQQGDCLSTDGQGPLSRWMQQYWQHALDIDSDETTLLDIGCGNAGLAQLLDQHNPNHVYIGIDAARTANSLDVTHWQLHSATPLSSWLVRGASNTTSPITHLVSQFGFEYCGRNTTGTTLDAHLVKAGIIRFVMHHDESILTRVAKLEQQILTHLLAQELWTTVLPEALEKVATNEQKQPLQDMNSLLAQSYTFAQGHEQLVNDLFADVFTLIQKVHQRQLGEREWQASCADMHLHATVRRDILGQQLAVARNKSALATFLRDWFGTFADQLSIKPLRVQNELLAWEVSS